MSRARRILLTGATGFLGSHLADAFLRRGDRVVALVRPSESAPARERLDEVLGRVREKSLDSEARDELEVVEGDVAAPDLGLEPHSWRELAGRIDEVWHSAASLSFNEANRSELFQMNVEGTRHILEFSKATASGRLHHLSTAYVAGDREGLALESELDVGQSFRNPYEESKCRAESLISESQSRGRVAATIYRPSVVIGHSSTGRATHLHGVYAFIRGLWTAVERSRQKTGQPIVELPLRIRGSLDATLNFVPIDYVTDSLLYLAGRKSDSGETYHLTNPQETPNRQWLSVVCDQLGVRGIELVAQSAFEDRPMSRLESVFHRQMAFYYPYLTATTSFDCRRTREALESTGIECPAVTEEFNRRMTGWYVDHLDHTAKAAATG